MSVKPEGFEQSVREQYSEDFDKCFEYLFEGNDKHDLVLLVLEAYADNKEGQDEFIKEVKEYS